MTATKIAAPSSSPEVEQRAGADELQTSTPAQILGVHHNMSERDYFCDPLAEHGGSLSHSGAKLLLDCPAKYAYRVLGGNEQVKASFDFGSAAHAKVLGVGNVAVLDHPDWRSKAAKEEADAARAEGATPLLVKDWATVEAMAEQIEAHPIASQLLTAPGHSEVSLFWEADGIYKRARIDRLPEPDADGRLIVADYKTTTDGGAAVRTFERSVLSYGYHSQSAWYSEAVLATLGIEPRFVFVVQEKEPPYVVNVIELSAELKAMGAERMQRAVAVYKQCRETGVWPGYSEGVELATAPTWASYEHEENREKWGMVA